jgi:hypothetical protein
MLSDRERQEFSLIEQGLRADSRFAASFPGRRRPPLHLRPGVVRTSIAIGLLIALSGFLLGAGGLFLQGTLLAGTGYGWWLWRGKRAAVNWTGFAGPHAGPGGGSGRSTEPI